MDLEPLDREDLAFVQDLIARHVELTGSRLGARLLSEWRATALQFTKVMPRDYKRALATTPSQVSDTFDTTPTTKVSDTCDGLQVAHG